MSFFGSGSAAMDPRMLLSASMSDNRAWGDLFVDSSSRDGAPAVAPVASAAAAPSAAAAAHFSNDQLLDLLDTTSRDGLNLIVKVRARRSWKGGKEKEKANRLLRGHPTNRLLTPPPRAVAPPLDAQNFSLGGSEGSAKPASVSAGRPTSPRAAPVSAARKDKRWGRDDIDARRDCPPHTHTLTHPSPPRPFHIAGVGEAGRPVAREQRRQRRARQQQEAVRR
jgi:hypothetical protein